MVAYNNFTCVISFSSMHGVEVEVSMKNIPYRFIGAKVILAPLISKRTVLLQKYTFNTHQRYGLWLGVEVCSVEFYLRHEPPLFEILFKLSYNPSPRRRRKHIHCALHETNSKHMPMVCESTKSSCN